MRDRIFEGPSLGEAVQQASRLLGVAGDRLRYVRLEGSGPTVRIAVLAGSEERSAAPESEAPEETIRGIVTALARAMGSPIQVQWEQREPSRVKLRLSGQGCAGLVEDGTLPLKALELLLQKAVGSSLSAPRLTIDCEGYREGRDRELRELAARLAQEVRERGAAREAPRLNSYERRQVHMALSTEPGLTTYSQGEGPERRLMVAPSAAALPEAAPPKEPQ
jgi:spoIIIJ-associated protein